MIRPHILIAGAAALVLLSAGPGLAEPAAQAAGAQVFADSCAACHQAKGEGVKGAFPALAGNAFVQGDAKALASTVLQGRGGMPSFSGDLNDDQLAQVLSFIRSSWGNKADAVTPDVVAAARTGGDSGTSLKALQAH